MKPVVYRERARNDLAEIARYIARRSGSVRSAEAYVRDLRARLDRCAQLDAGFGRPRPDLGPQIRTLPHDRYVIVFRHLPAFLQIVRIVHGARHFDRLRFDEPQREFVHDTL